jgi:hypothetical protein
MICQEKQKVQSRRQGKRTTNENPALYRVTKPLGIGVFLLVVASCVLRAAPPHAKASPRQKLTSSLRTAAVPVCSAWRTNLAAHVQAEELKDLPGKWMRLRKALLVTCSVSR